MAESRITINHMRDFTVIELGSSHLFDKKIVALALATPQYIPRGHVRVLDHGDSRSASMSEDSQTSSISKEHISINSFGGMEEPRIITILAEYLGHTGGRIFTMAFDKVRSLGSGLQDGQQILLQRRNGKARNSLTQTPRTIDRHLQGKSIDRAGQNCRTAHIVISTLQNAVTILDFENTLSRCDWTAKEGRQSNSAALEWWLQARSEMFPAEPVRDNPQSLNQMIRMTTWMLAEIEDELRSLIIAKRMRGDEWKIKKLEFIRKWGNELQPCPAIQVNFNHQEITKDTNAELFLAGSLTNSQIPWISVVTYWDVLCKSFRDNSTIRETVDGRAKYDFDLCTIQDIIHKMTPSLALRKQVNERCVQNVKLVQGILCSFHQEILDELERRRSCKHARLRKTHHSTTKTLDKALGVLKRMNKEICKIAIKIDQMRFRPLRYTDGDFKLLMDWGSLDGNSYRQLVGLTSDELVARLVEQAIPEDTIIETDDLVKCIKTGLLQTRTDAIIATRKEEYQRARAIRKYWDS